MALTRRQLLMVAAETTYGTSAAPVGTEALLVLEPSLTPLDGELLEREVIDPAFGRSRSRLVAMRKMGVEFGVEMAHSGTLGTAPKYGPLFKACGFSEAVVASTSVTYAPTSTITDSATINHNWDGNRHLGTGARGTFEIAMQAGAIPRFNFTMTGIYNPPNDVEMPTPTYTNQAAPLDVNSVNTATASVASLSACMQEFSCSIGNTVEFFDFAGCTKQVRITDRMVEGSITIERPDALSTKDFYSLAIAGTTGAINVVHGPAGNRITINLPTVNFGPPTPADANGLAMLSIPFVALHTAGSSDEITIAYT